MSINDKMQNESSPSRSELWRNLSSQEFDICVIGGGINGAGIARDAALRGLKVALIEKKDFAWGTSSRSSKLAHGGFRYLEHYKFGLVMESLRERKVLMNIAPHNVHPLPFFIPVYKGEKPSFILLRLGLIVYEYLSLGKRIGRRKWHSSKKGLKLFPTLRKDGLKGIGQYYDCYMNDARLCLENILSAVDDGATILNYVEVMDFEKDEKNNISGVIVKDVETNSQTVVRTKVVVNAAGPWSDLVKKKDDEKTKKRLANAKGVHIITKRVIKDNKALAIILRDGRIVFIVPFRDNFTLIGTTDTFYKGNIENVVCSEEEVNYLLDGYNRFFPDNPLTKKDVISSFAGLRPLVYDEKKGASSSDVSREHKIFHDRSVLISIVGGKYTTYRKLAKTVTDMAVKSLKNTNNISKNIAKCKTDKVELKGGKFSTKDNWDNLLSNQIVELKSLFKVDEKIIKHLLINYGVMTKKVLTLSESNSELLNKIVPNAPYIFAEVEYSIEYEYCRSLEDFYWLRTFLALETDFTSSIDKVASIFAELLNWDQKRKNIEKKIVLERIKVAQFLK